MTRRGTVIVCVAWLAAMGCADRELKDSDAPNGPNGSAATGGAGGVGGGDGHAGADAGDDVPGLACQTLPQAGVSACVYGEGFPYPGSDAADIEFTGTVEREADDARRCGEQPNRQTFGFTAGRALQRYVVRDGATAIGLSLQTGSAAPLLAIGQRVRVAAEKISSSRNESIALSVRDDASGDLLYWFTSTVSGTANLLLPEGLTASDLASRCSDGEGCERAIRGGLRLSDGSDDIALEIGELAVVGDHAAVLFDNTELGSIHPPEGCFDSFPRHFISLALLPRDRVTKCDWLDENACRSDDDCKDIYVVFSGTDPEQTFITCVDQVACGGSDATVCAINDETQQPVRFTTTCVPPGWTQSDHACDGFHTDDDAGAP